MKRIIVLFFALLVVATFGIAIVPIKTKALNNTFPDLNDTSGAGTTYNVSAETQFVQKTDNNMRVWFPTPNGTVAIQDPNFCASNAHDSIQKGDYFFSNAIPNASITTTFSFNNGASIQYGKKYASGAAACTTGITYSITGIPATQIENGYYYVNLDISYHSLHAGNCSTAGITGCDGIVNYYRVSASAGSIIGVRTVNANGLNNTGYDTSQQLVTSSPAYTTYYGYFGTPCSIKVGTRAYLSFFDLDNAGGSGAQPVGNPITIKLWDRTDAAYQTLSNGSTVWTPPSKDNVQQTISFIAEPDHKYRLDVINVYYNNVIQYSVPYAQIYTVACKEAAIDPIATVTPASISLGQSVTFKNYVDITNNKNSLATDTFDYAIGFTKPAAGATPANATKAAATAPVNIPIPPIRANATNGPIDTLTFTPSAEGTYCRTTTVSGWPVTFATVTAPNPASACVTVGPSPPPAGWQVKGITKAVGTDTSGNTTTSPAGGTLTLTVGDKFYFTHTISNDSASASSTTKVINYSTGGTSLVKSYSGTIASGLGVGSAAPTLGVSADAYVIKLGDVGTTICKDIKFDPTSDSNSASTTSAQACVKVIAPAAKCIGTVSTSLGRIQPGDKSNVTLGFNKSAIAQTLTYTISNGLGSGTNVPIAANATSYTLPAAITFPDTAADYTVDWSISSAPAGDCAGTISVVDMPYFTVYGGGVHAGGDFAGSCTSGGTLSSWHNTNGVNYGSSTELSAIALAAITGFASAETMGGAPNKLAFANNTAYTTHDDSPAIGGTYGGNYCMSRPTKPTSGVTDVTSPVELSGVSGAYHVGGDATLNNVDVADGDNVSLFVDGDLYISGNIRYTNTSWASQDVIPSIVIVARNIYIDASVTNLDGTYAAVNTNATDGNIYTCANASGIEAQASLYDNCNNQLLVHGSFIAKRVHFMRTYGTLKDDAANANCHNKGTPASPKHASCAGEVFEFSPEMYLSSPAIKPPSNGALNYDAIVNLPPIL